MKLRTVAQVPTDGVEAMPSNPHEDGAPPAEAILIRRARDARGLSPEEAAKRLKMSMSGRRWRQLEKGLDSSTGRETHMSDPVLAHMAYVVGVSAEQLSAIGKGEAAAILQEIHRQQETPEVPDYVIREDTEAWEWEIWTRLALLGPEDKELIIEFIRGVRRRAARAGDEVDRSSGRRTG